jgi:hypothetical protein
MDAGTTESRRRLRKDRDIMTRTALRHPRRSARYLAVGAMALSMLALHVSGAAAFDPQPIPPGGPAHMGQTANVSWGGGVGDSFMSATGGPAPYAPANDPSV